ncbi:MAG TPA: SGNH/GDSL hydrolase family protein [Terriglobia bacterium]|nr:SGNH/GDSL hydrolase family protein [Terriglobia bacterium]
MHHDGEKKTGLVPFPRFFSVLGYSAFWCVAILVLAEAASRIVLPIYHHFSSPLLKVGPDSENLLSQRRGAGLIGALFFDNVWLDMSSASPAYVGYGWAEDFWKEQRSRFEFENARPAPYEPFRIWGMEESHGKYINVDKTEMGARRRTFNPLQPGCESRQAQKVWVFGASTTWGYGTPDFETIPSNLSKNLNSASGNCVEVSNLGVDGYNTNQEVVYLIQQLKAGGLPDAVVFFDGYADAYVGTLGPGLPSTHWDYDEIKAKQQSTVINWPDLVKRSSFLSFMDRLRMRLRRSQGTLSDQERAARVKSTMDNYELNLALVRVLAREYGFDAFFFWQPYVLYGKKPLVLFEQNMLDDRAIHDVYKEADRRAAETGKFIFLGGVFDRVKEPVYIDSVHLGPLGNEIIAGAIAAQIQPALLNRRAKLEDASKGKPSSSP